MNFADFLRAVFALAVTLGLVGVAAVALRRYGPDALARFGQAPRKERRLKVVETLVLDPARRLLIVECDGQERLLLLGEGRLLGETAADPTKAAGTTTQAKTGAR
jgi:flagellar protein FliO/FliZ